jgi:NADH-quinone oxidoreductase subunit G
MSDNSIKVEVNGVELDARPGEMLIAVTDRAGIYVPRFCYHEKLSVAANCRMCLVDVANVPKPLPACATPVTNGMKVATRSQKAIGAQKATMEFLLINHPLDCPICDQGGECELQDLAMGFGRDVARFAEGKRSLIDRDIGPLISTDMTRCILCTRCVRFGAEIAGIQELGTIGRGERTQIASFVGSTVDHELSGNVIDLCPVGALNNKPYRFSARAWEMQALPSIAPHDCVGSNLSAHVLLGRVKRVVPRVNEEINETWLSDRDRFSYAGIYAPDRLPQPMIREGGEWRVGSWEEALQLTASRLAETVCTDGGAGLGAWVAPSSTLEEGYLLQRLLRHLGSENIDHRLRRRDFRLEERDPVFPSLGVSLAEIQSADAILVIGSNLRREAPMLAHRVRKAAVSGAAVMFVNPQRHEYLHPVAGYIETGADLVSGLRRFAAAADAEAAAIAARLKAATAAGKRAVIILGQIAGRHPRFADLRQMAGELAHVSGAELGYLSEGANSAGLALAGVLPHRGAGGAATSGGRNIAQMIGQPPKSLVLLGCEPDKDCSDGELAVKAMQAAGFVVALTSYWSDALKAHAHVVLPVGTFAETAGTFVNGEGRWQSFNGVANPVGESRPAWKVLRVLGNLLQMPDCEYASADEIRTEVRKRVPPVQPHNVVLASSIPPAPTSADIPLAELDVPMYQIDAVVRRTPALQLTREARTTSGAAGIGQNKRGTA